MIDRREMVEDESEAGLELLAEFPGHGEGRGRVMEYVADQVQPSEFARNGGGVDYEG